MRRAQRAAPLSRPLAESARSGSRGSKWGQGQCQPRPPPTSTLKRHNELFHSVRLEMFASRPWIPITVAGGILLFVALGIAFRA